MAPTNLIQHSFELAAERCEDLTPLVYRRLFREHPEAEAMFRSQASELVKGSMLALTIADTLREILRPDWSPEMDEAWRKLLAEIDQVVARSEA
jgi:hemoglobin-like flavoprotein